MRRREFIGLIGGAAGWPFTTRAQQRAMPVVGFLSSRSPSESSGAVDSFRRGLRQIGFVEGQSVAIAFRWVMTDYHRWRLSSLTFLSQRCSRRVVPRPHSRPKQRLRQFQLFSYRATPLAWGWLQTSAIPVETSQASAIWHPTSRANPPNC